MCVDEYVGGAGGCVVCDGRVEQIRCAAIGASHQTGWTGLVAPLIEMYGSVTAQKILKGGKKAAFARGEPAPEDMKKSAVIPSRG